MADHGSGSGSGSEPADELVRPTPFWNFASWQHRVGHHGAFDTSSRCKQNAWSSGCLGAANQASLNGPTQLALAAAAAAAGSTGRSYRAAVTPSLTDYGQARPDSGGAAPTDASGAVFGFPAALVCPANGALHKNPRTVPVGGPTCDPLGSDPTECPSGTCVYQGWSHQCDGSAFGRGRIAAAFCDKVQWDAKHVVPCCLGQADAAAAEGGTDAALLCDPRWSVADPAAACGPAIHDTCVVAGPDGSTPLLADPTHGCNAWYTGVRNSGTGMQWAAADAMVDEACQRYPSAPACACHRHLQCIASNQGADQSKCGAAAPVAASSTSGGGGGSGSGDKAYELVAGVDPATGGNLCAAQQACLARKSCLGDTTNLLTWSDVQQLSSCPEATCFQSIHGQGTMTLAKVTAKSLFVLDEALRCDANVPSPGTSGGGAAQLWADRTVLMSGMVDKDGNTGDTFVADLVLRNRAPPGSDDLRLELTLSDPTRFRFDPVLGANVSACPASAEPARAAAAAAAAAATGVPEPQGTCLHVTVPASGQGAGVVVPMRLVDPTYFSAGGGGVATTSFVVSAKDLSGKLATAHVRVIVAPQRSADPLPPLQCGTSGGTGGDTGEVPCPGSGTVKVRHKAAWWGWALLGLGAALLAGGAVAAGRELRAKRRQPASAPRLSEGTPSPAAAQGGGGVR